MTVNAFAPGKIEYFFTHHCKKTGETQTESVAQTAKGLVPVFKKAETTNEASELALAFIAFLGTLVSPIPGDEALGAAAVSSSLNQALALAGLA